MKKPSKHCEMGSYDHQVPMAISHRRQDIDLCIADVVAALNAANLITTWSCCGHGQLPSVIGLEDGRHICVYNSMKGWEKHNKPK